MTTATMNKSDLMAPPVAETIQTRSLFIGLVGTVAAVAGAFTAPENFYSAYLTVFMFWLGLSLGCMAILMLYHLVGGSWGTVIRRILEAGMMTLPLMAVLFIPILLNLPKLYPWARPDELAKDPKLADIAHSYLNFNGIMTRAALYFVLWMVMAYLLNRWSTAQDSVEGRDKSTLRFRALSAPGLVIYSFTISFAVIDWVMSLQARWISTIYGLIFVAGEALLAFCFAVVIEHILLKRKPMSEYLKPTEIHDHGKFMLTFVMVWAYFNFSQWLIIWSGNLPEEITWFLRRIHGGWGLRRRISGGLPLRHSLFAAPVAPMEAPDQYTGLDCLLADRDAAGGPVVAHRTRFPSHHSRELDAVRGLCRHGRAVDGLSLPQFEIASAAGGVRAADAEASGVPA